MTHWHVWWSCRSGLTCPLDPPPPCRRGTQYLAVLCLLYLRVTDTTRLLLTLSLSSSSAGRRDAGGVVHGSWDTRHAQILDDHEGTLALWHWVTSATTPHTHTRRLTREPPVAVPRGEGRRAIECCRRARCGAPPAQGQSTEAVAPARMSSRLPTE